MKAPTKYFIIIIVLNDGYEHLSIIFNANIGVDIRFLQLASKLATGSIYSLHKTSTRQVGIGLSALLFDIILTYHINNDST